MGVVMGHELTHAFDDRKFIVILGQTFIEKIVYPLIRIHRGPRI